MVSGSTLLNYQQRYSAKEYFYKRIWKKVFPFLSWSLLACADQLRVTLRGGKSLDFNLLNMIDGILNVRYLQTYWFFIPLLRVFVHTASGRDKR